MHVPWSAEADNIDLVPEPFFIERWCNVSRGDEDTITIPKKRVFAIHKWSGMPYLTEEDFQKVLEDFPDESVPGRSGEVVTKPRVARACRQECTLSGIRSQFKYLEGDIDKSRLTNIKSKNRNLPGNYYGGDTKKFITPDNIPDAKECKKTYVHKGGDSVQMWKW